MLATVVTFVIIAHYQEVDVDVCKNLPINPNVIPKINNKVAGVHPDHIVSHLPQRSLLSRHLTSSDWSKTQDKDFRLV